LPTPIGGLSHHAPQKDADPRITIVNLHQNEAPDRRCLWA
jgi:hypothetical protein